MPKHQDAFLSFTIIVNVIAPIGVWGLSWKGDREGARRPVRVVLLEARREMLTARPPYEWGEVGGLESYLGDGIECQWGSHVP